VTGDMLLSSRSGRKGPIACLVGLLLIFALYQLGIICGSTRYMPAAVMVSKEVRTQTENFNMIFRSIKIVFLFQLFDEIKRSNFEQIPFRLNKTGEEFGKILNI